MDAARPSDPLLRVTRLLLFIAMVLVALTGAALLAAIPSLWVFGDSIIAAAARHGINFGKNALAAAWVICGLGFAFMALSYQFLRKLVAIIDSLGEGSPFIPENARRLRTMAWMVLAIQGLTLLVAPIAVWLQHAIPYGRVHIVASVSLEGLIAALLLFILARVFDHGIRLEQDVEGTV